MNYGKKQLKKKLTETGSEERRQKNRFFMFLVMLFVAVFVGGTVCLMAAGIGAFTEILRNVPEVESVDMIEPDENKSIIYAADGSIMQELVRSGSNRINVPFEQFPDHLVDAFIAIEDSRFFTHDGVDVKGIIRAVFVGLTSGNLSEGASTITQQLIKNNVFDGGFEKNLGDRFERKLQEQYLALRVEQELSKTQIIEYYLNTINLGSNCLGVQVASKRYFNKDVSELNLAECTVLAATTSSPSRYDPIKHPENNQRRRKIVLQYMLNNGAISAEEYDSAIGEDVYKRVQAVAANYTGVQVFSYFTDTVFEDVLSHLESDLGYSEAKALSLMYSGGLRIYTTEDPVMQKIAEEEANRASNYYYIDESGVVREKALYKLNYSLGVKLENDSEFFYNENNLAEFFKNVKHVQDFSLIFPTEEDLRSAVSEYRDFVLEETGGK
ncbi:MAG: transglycosylase domain-containing protein, partial [Lachnospiraceae bacterium]|nr:transglycosylase domain-containing protein [Lachnospiraceae bacterium]